MLLENWAVSIIFFCMSENGLRHTMLKGGIPMSANKGKKKKNKSKEELNAMKGGRERHRRNRS